MNTFNHTIQTLAREGRSDSFIVRAVRFINTHPEMVAIKDKLQRAVERVAPHSDRFTAKRVPYKSATERNKNLKLPRRLSKYVHEIFRLNTRIAKLECRLRKQFFALDRVKREMATPAPVVSWNGEWTDVEIDIRHHPSLRKMKRQVRRLTIRRFRRRGINTYTAFRKEPNPALPSL